MFRLRTAQEDLHFKTTGMIYGITKGTDFEKLCEGAAKAEAAGVMMYYALARMAKEQGYPEEVSEKFIEMANQEAVHAGFYGHSTASSMPIFGSWQKPSLPERKRVRSRWGCFPGFPRCRFE